MSNSDWDTEARLVLTWVMLATSNSWYWSAMMEARWPVVLVWRSTTRATVLEKLFFLNRTWSRS